MSETKSPAPVAALIYPEGFAIDRLMRHLAEALVARGFSLAGFLQQDAQRPGKSRCDMVLEEVASGERILISEDRGEHARGCRLDSRELARAEALALKAVEHGPDVLLINKFGKSEAQGGGFRTLLARALELGVPVLIAVPVRNVEAWREFAGELSVEWPVEARGEQMQSLCDSLGFAAQEIQQKQPAWPVAAP